MPGAEAACQPAHEQLESALYPASIQRLGGTVMTGELHVPQLMHEISAMPKEAEAASPHRLGLDPGTPEISSSHPEIDIGGLTVQKVIQDCPHFAAIAAANPELARTMVAKEVRNLQEVASLRQAGLSEKEVRERQWAVMGNRFKGKTKPEQKPDTKIEKPQVKPVEQQTVVADESPEQRQTEEKSTAVPRVYLPKEVNPIGQRGEVRQPLHHAAIRTTTSKVPAAERLAELPAEHSGSTHGTESAMQLHIRRAYEESKREGHDGVLQLTHRDVTEAAGRQNTNPDPSDGSGDPDGEAEPDVEVESSISLHGDTAPAYVDDADDEEGGVADKLASLHIVTPSLRQTEAFNGSPELLPRGVEVSGDSLEVYAEFAEALQVLVLVVPDQPVVQLTSEAPVMRSNELAAPDEIQDTQLPARITAQVAEKLSILTAQEKEEVIPIVVDLVDTVRAIAAATAEEVDPAEAIEIIRAELDGLVVSLFTRLGIAYEAADTGQFITALLRLDILMLRPDTRGAIEVSLEQMGTHEVKIRMPRDAATASAAGGSRTIGRLFTLGMFALFSTIPHLGRELAAAAT